MLVDLVEITSDVISDGIPAKAEITLTVEAQHGFGDKIDSEVGEIKEQIAALFQPCDGEPVFESSIGAESLTDIVASIKIVQTMKGDLFAKISNFERLTNVADEDVEKFKAVEYIVENIAWCRKIEKRLMEKASKLVEETV